MDDELVILGSGGGRHHIRTQHRATGGILYKFEGIQAHLDPGPGATVRLNQYHEDPTRTELFIVTHGHLDHCGDINAVIESSRAILHDRQHNYFQKGTLIAPPDTLRFITPYHQKMLETIIPFKAGQTIRYKGHEIVGTKVMHSNMDGFGVRFNLDAYSLVFTSDTNVFEGFADQYNGVEIMVLNLLRPDSVYCKRHLCTDEVIPYLNQITPTPKALIITHFGSFMDGPRSEINHVPGQVEKFRAQTSIDRILAAEDGLRISISELL